MENKEFRFQGLDAKTEVRLGLWLILPALTVMLGTSYLTSSVLMASVLTVGVITLLLKFLVKRIKDREWIIRIEHNQLHIMFRNHSYIIPLEHIKNIKNMGNVGFRYLTIETQDQKVKIRVGNTALTPFSTEKDVETVDRFIQHLKPYIDKNFNQRILKNKINNNVLPNFGEYVVKSEKIRYSLITKMNPQQVMILFFFGGLLFTLLILWGALHFLT